MNQLDPLDPEDSIHMEEAGSPATWDYQPDPEVVEVLAETEQLETPTSQIAGTLRQYTDESPELSGGDEDADWERGDATGEETVGGSVATPEQNQVEDLGQAWGVVYQDEEPLHTIDKLEQRDRDRWELNPASKDETEEGEA